MNFRHFLSCFVISGLLLFIASSLTKPPQRAAHKHVGANSFNVVIYKSKYELQVFDEQGWLYTYPVVFGTSEMKDKMMEGDKQTPEGQFRIVHKKMHPEWGPFLLLDYPNQESLEKFKQRKERGEIPPYAKPGGGIGIHATRKNEDRFVDFYYNWTLGCVSTKRTYARELYNLLPVGTPVTIHP